jgi:raffinose/stachyose/melibiose transport system permease protein
MLFVHAALLGFGLLNLYPFFWMLGTSIKADAESSNDRMTPFPHLKYKLAEGLDVERAMPEALQPGLAGAEGKRRVDLLNLLQKKLEVLHALQRAAWDDEVRHTVGPPDADAVLRRLVQAGLLTQDAARRAHWLSDAAYRRRWPADLAPADRAALEALWDAQTITPKAVSVLVQLRSLGEAGALLGDMAHGAGAPLVEATPAPEEDGPAYRLADGARGRIYRDLYPRQVLTLWFMHQENVRRSESRNTYATDRWSASDYQNKFGLADGSQARRELAAMLREGYLADATVQAINYWVVLREENFLLYFMTSLVITVVVVFASVMVSSMLGYALARMSFPGKFLTLGVLIAASILPSEARIIPVFKMLLATGALEGLWGMVVWMASGGVGYTLVMAGFFLTLPKEIDEAAEVDGAGVLRKFFDISLPMARPVVMTVMLFAFLGSWNNFLVPLLCTIARPSMQPLAVAVYNFQQGHAGKWHEINAAAAVMVVPVIVLFLFVQKHIVKAIAVGALKG